MPQSDPGEGSYRLARWSKTPGSGRPKTDPGEGSNKITFVCVLGLEYRYYGKVRCCGMGEVRVPEPVSSLWLWFAFELDSCATLRAPVVLYPAGI